jgi:hypothetical protein
VFGEQACDLGYGSGAHAGRDQVSPPKAEPCARLVECGCATDAPWWTLSLIVNEADRYASLAQVAAVGEDVAEHCHSSMRIAGFDHQPWFPQVRGFLISTILVDLRWGGLLQGHHRLPNA